MIDASDYVKTGIYRDPSERQPSTLYLNDMKIGTSIASVSQLAGAPTTHGDSPAAARWAPGGGLLPAHVGPGQPPKRP